MLIKRVVLFALVGMLPHVPGLLVLALADLLDFVLLFYMVLVFGWSLLSMFAVDTLPSVLRLVGGIVDPLLKPLRGKLVPGMIDFVAGGGDDRPAARAHADRGAAVRLGYPAGARVLACFACGKRTCARPWPPVAQVRSCTHPA